MSTPVVSSLIPTPPLDRFHGPHTPTPVVRPFRSEEDRVGTGHRGTGVSRRGLRLAPTRKALHMGDREGTLLTETVTPGVVGAVTRTQRKDSGQSFRSVWIVESRRTRPESGDSMVPHGPPPGVGGFIRCPRNPP